MARLKYENATLRQLLRVADQNTEPGLAKQFANTLKESSDTISSTDSKTLHADNVIKFFIRHGFQPLSQTFSLM